MRFLTDGSHDPNGGAPVARCPSGALEVHEHDAIS